MARFPSLPHLSWAPRPQEMEPLPYPPSRSRRRAPPRPGANAVVLAPALPPRGASNRSLPCRLGLRPTRQSALAPRGLLCTRVCSIWLGVRRCRGPTARSDLRAFFYIGDLSVHRFWHLRGPWKQSPADTEGQLSYWGVKSYMSTFDGPWGRGLSQGTPALFKGQSQIGK